MPSPIRLEGGPGGQALQRRRSRRPHRSLQGERRQEERRRRNWELKRPYSAYPTPRPAWLGPPRNEQDSIQAYEPLTDHSVTHDAQRPCSPTCSPSRTTSQLSYEVEPCIRPTISESMANTYDSADNLSPFATLLSESNTIERPCQPDTYYKSPSTTQTNVIESSLNDSIIHNTTDSNGHSAFRDSDTLSSSASYKRNTNGPASTPPDKTPVQSCNSSLLSPVVPAASRGEGLSGEDVVMADTSRSPPYIVQIPNMIHLSSPVLVRPALPESPLSLRRHNGQVIYRAKKQVTKTATYKNVRPSTPTATALPDDVPCEIPIASNPSGRQLRSRRQPAHQDDFDAFALSPKSKRSIDGPQLEARTKHLLQRRDKLGSSARAILGTKVGRSMYAAYAAELNRYPVGKSESVERLRLVLEDLMNVIISHVAID